MLTPSLNTVMTRLLIVAAVLATLMLFAPAASAQSDEPIEFAENSEDAVRVFTSSDPEGAQIDWDVTGLDADDFTIEDGYLMFVSPPDYENPTDRERDDDATTADLDETATSSDNLYIITVRASERRASGETGRALSTETDVMVQVTNEEEDGDVELSWLQPEVGTPITATLSDEDGVVGEIEWTWTVSRVTDPDPDVDGHWQASTGTVGDEPTMGLGVVSQDQDRDSNTYVPAGKCVTRQQGASDRLNGPCPDTAVTAMDEGRILRAFASYTDGEGEDKEAIGVSMYPVRAEVSSDSDAVENPENGSPGFTAGGDYTREVKESLAVGMEIPDPVTARDPNDDILSYDLWVNPGADNEEDPIATTTYQVNNVTYFTDMAFVSIDKATGQLTLTKTLSTESETPSGAMTDKRFYGDNGSTAGEYVVMVRAVDPSGETDVQVVTITAEGDNDPPKIVVGATELRVNEQDSDDDSYDGMPELTVRPPVGTVVGTDPITTGTEDQSNTYRASDEDARDQVTWSVEGDDASLFVLSAANLHGENEPRDLRFIDPPDYETPSDANGDSVYNVTVVATDEEDARDTIDVTIFVDNVQEDGEIALMAEGDNPDQPLTGMAITATLDDPDNDVAVITWQWSHADNIDTVTSSPIAGATESSYTPVTADDGKYLRVSVVYTDTLSKKDDLMTPGVDERVQEVQTVNNENVTMAKEPNATSSTPDGGVQYHLYSVKATSKFAVKVVPDPEDPDDPTEGPAFSASTIMRMVAENARIGDRVGDPVTAMRAVGYEMSSNTGDDANFSIDQHGQITVAGVGPNDDMRPDLNHEDKSSYTVLVEAEDSAGRTTLATVEIVLIDLNESPYFVENSREDGAALTNMPDDYMENRTAAVESFQAVDPDGGEIVWSLWGTDASDFTIDDGTLRFASPPDYETPSDRAHVVDPDDTANNDEAENNVYRLMVRATEAAAVGGGPDKYAELDVTVTVVNDNEPGMVELEWLQPQFNVEIDAMLDDEDESGSVTWTWYRSKVGNPDMEPDPSDMAGILTQWAAVDGTASGNTYTPNADDVGRYLLARAMYEYDADGTGVDPATTTHAIGVSANVVREAPGSNNSPDFRHNKTTRTVMESVAVGDPVGRPVKVDINEDPDILSYEIVTEAAQGDLANSDVIAADHPFFSIDKATGQVMVADELSFEDHVDEIEGSTDGRYRIVVRAVDPFGDSDAENYDDITVVITATDVNEAPSIVSGNSEIFIFEGDELSATTSQNLYTKSDPDRNDAPRWELNGDDGNLFQLSTPEDGIGRRIHFRSAPDFEAPQDMDGDNVYEVDVVVIDNLGARGVKAVRVEVMNNNEDGEVELGPMQPNIMDPATASLSDADGIMTGADDEETITSWQWYTTDAAAELCVVRDSNPTTNNRYVIVAEEANGDCPSDAGTSTEAISMLAGETSDTYDPGMDDIGNYLHVVVTYRDGYNKEDDPVTDDDERGAMMPLGANADRALIASFANAVQAMGDDSGTSTTSPDTAPMFEDDSPVITVPENTPSTGYVGGPILATDDGSEELTYEIGGANASRFFLARLTAVSTDPELYHNDVTATPAVDDDRDSGPAQIAVAAVTHLDADGSDDTYMVEVTATDAEGQRATAMVTIMVTNVNEAPSAPRGFSASARPMPTNTAPMFAATSTTFSVDENTTENTATGTVVGTVTATDADRGDTLAYSLDDGADAGSFSIDSATGEITTSAMLDYETQGSYMVTVTATDDDEATDMIYVTIMVNDLGLDTSYDADESGVIDGTEVLNAVRDYFDDLITGPEVLEVVRLYFENV